MPAAGGCLCGAVRFEVDGPLRDILVCHCVECRRWSGGPWAATSARAADLSVAGGDDLGWRPSPQSDHGAERGFCVRCGSSLFWRIPEGRTVSISAGALDDPAGLPVAAHIWVDHALDRAAPPAGVATHPRGLPADAPRLGWHERE
jgi:hypothetical protein